jgi:uncharacterized protein YceK
MRRSLSRLVVIFALALLPGCGTVGTLALCEPYPYGGAGNDLHNLVHPRSFSGEGAGVVINMLDLPFSFCADTALLPITILIHRSRPPWEYSFGF